MTPSYFLNILYSNKPYKLIKILNLLNNCLKQRTKMASMVDELKDIEKSLELLTKDLDTQMSSYNIENDKFHDSLISLSGKLARFDAKNSDDNEVFKELLHFIVSINDRLVTSHILARDMFYDTIIELIQQKRFLIKKLIKDYEEKTQPKESNISKIFDFFKANKIVLLTIGITIAFTLLMMGIFVIPSETLEALKLLKGMTGK